jgi:hypothetical protein
MGELSRIGVAIDGDLPDKFDRPIAQRGYTSRPEAFREVPVLRGRAPEVRKVADAPIGIRHRGRS